MPRRHPPEALPPFERVVDQHGPAVLRFCAARVSPERAEDCFQETMLAALRAYDALRDPEAVAGWLTDHYLDEGYPALVLGSPHGAAVHLAAAMGAPWLRLEDLSALGTVVQGMRGA